MSFTVFLVMGEMSLQMNERPLSEGLRNEWNFQKKIKAFLCHILPSSIFLAIALSTRMHFRYINR